MVSKPVLRMAGDPDNIDGDEEDAEGETRFTRLEVATAVTLCVGIIQVGGISRIVIVLGISAFMCGVFLLAPSHYIMYMLKLMLSPPLFYFQTCLGLLRLGSFSILLTDCLVSAFTVGASFHVFTR